MTAPPLWRGRVLNEASDAELTEAIALVEDVIAGLEHVAPPLHVTAFFSTYLSALTVEKALRLHTATGPTCSAP